MNVHKIRNLQHVYRFNFHRVNRRQSVAEHSFFVALFAEEFSKVIYPEYSEYNPRALDVMRLALYHDIEEAVTGDIPYLIRREISSDVLYDLESWAREILGVHSHNMSKIDFEIIDFADAYELKLYLEEERLSGNTQLVDIEKETYARLVKNPLWDRLYDPYGKILDEVDLPDHDPGLTHGRPRNND